ncbi:MAG TPA: hypothetical protein VMH80_03705 [Bryobacteraceae bacterium]|nr:hypothetical protein [Bryobacteraceae bacterium]
MAFLVFLKKRQQQTAQPKPQQPKPETAKQMYTREAAQQPRQNALESLSGAERGRLDEIKARIEKATQHAGHDSPAREASVADTPVTQQPMRQNMTAQDKSTPAMSPTSAQAGMTSVESGASVRPTATPKVQQKTSQKPQQTIARPRPSWER